MSTGSKGKTFKQQYSKVSSAATKAKRAHTRKLNEATGKTKPRKKK